MKRTAIGLAGLSLTQCLAIAAFGGLPVLAQAQSRPNIQETMAPVPGRKSYAQDLVDRTVSRNTELIELDVHATPPGSSQSVIVAAKSRARIGKPTDADDLAVFKSGEPRVEINGAGNNNVEVGLQLQDVTGRPVGVVEMTFPYIAGTDESALVKKAEAIRDGMRRRISYGSEDLVAPAQFDPQVPVDTYAQYLVDDTLEKQPGVAVMVLHIKDPKSGDYPIIASNIGRIGKAADESDLQVIRSGTTRVARNVDDRRLEVKLPMKDAAGNTIGAVAIVFPRRSMADDATLAAQAERIRDELGRRVANASNLYGAYPTTRAERVVQTEYDKPELGNSQSLPMTKAVTSGQTLEQASQEGYSEAVKGVARATESPEKSAVFGGVKV